MFTIRDIINILRENPRETIKDALGAIAVVAGGFVLAVAMILFMG